ncbi:N-acetylneuraminate lyase [Neobacillus jeddahensis]|uniref:N-acetylneuraminate lyase n=1 Tax=Neobacillus jeddahensis TaxID=1461580 RepID=UPI00058E6B67|nr:N-acetylneuraminate lyase [Neobacillus jeddahensis]
MDKYKGIFPALVTPYTNKGEIHEASLRKIVRMNLEKGVKGFYVNGSTAETFLLHMEERKRLIDIVTDEAKGKATIIYHVGSIRTDDSVEMAQYGEKVGVDAISAIPPFYYQFGFEEITKYYQTIIESVKVPMILYNFPTNSGVKISMDHFYQLLENERIIGVKHTSMNLFELERFKNKGKILFNGHDEIFLAGLTMGADGGIGSTYNLMSEKFIQIYNLYYENKLKEARKIQIEANNVIEALIKVGVNQGIKYGLEKMGISCNGCREPFKRLNEDDMRYLDQIFKENHLNL